MHLNEHKPSTRTRRLTATKVLAKGDAARPAACWPVRFVLSAPLVVNNPEPGLPAWHASALRERAERNVVKSSTRPRIPGQRSRLYRKAKEQVTTRSLRLPGTGAIARVTSGGLDQRINARPAPRA